MNHIQTERNELPSDSLAVEFYPSVDDYVHISERVSSSLRSPSIIQYAYQTFLLVNAVAFPGFLWFHEYYMAGIVILAINIVALTWLVPWLMRDGYRSYYEQVIGPRENEIARVELNSEGVRYTSDDGDSFMPWRRITAVEETDDAIFFYFLGNGFAVRKSGFAYRAQQDAFTQFVQSNLHAGRSLQLDR